MTAVFRRARSEPSGPPARDLRVVDEEPVAPPRRFVSVIGPLAVACLFVVLLAMAGLHALIVQGQTTIDQLDRDLAEAGAESDRLQLRLAELESPERIVAEARRLGMVDAPVVVYLTPSQPAPVNEDGYLQPAPVNEDRTR